MRESRELREVSGDEAIAIARKIRGGDRASGYVKKTGGVIWSKHQVEDGAFLSEMERDAIAIVHSHTRVKHCDWVQEKRGSEWGNSAHAVRGAILLNAETGAISTHSCPENPQVDFLTKGDIAFSKKLGIPIYLLMLDYDATDVSDADAIAQANAKPLVWDFFDPTYTTTAKSFVQSREFRKSDRFAINLRGANTLSELNEQIAAIASQMEERQYAAWERYRQTATRCNAAVEEAKAEMLAAKKRSLFAEAKFRQQRAALSKTATQQLYLTGAANPIRVEEWLRGTKQHHYV